MLDGLWMSPRFCPMKSDEGSETPRMHIPIGGWPDEDTKGWSALRVVLVSGAGAMSGAAARAFADDVWISRA